MKTNVIGAMMLGAGGVGSSKRTTAADSCAIECALPLPERHDRDRESL